MNKSWYLDRRTFLAGSGVSLALPWLECMGVPAPARPKRFCGVYFPYGVVMRKSDDPQAVWNWFPRGEGRDFTFNKSTASLEPLREQLTVFGGLSHPNGRKMGGHDTADTWLTGALLAGNRLRNTMSIDQLLARRHGPHTRYASLVLSSDGGVGDPTRSSTLSYNRNGQPIPAMNKPQMVYDRLFGLNPDSMAVQRRELDNSGSMLDLVLDHSRQLRRKLGQADQEKFDEYLDSVRQIEQRVERSRQWLNVPKPEVNATGLSLEADDTTPRELIQTMYDLIVLAFQTDSTRVATYQLGNMNGATSIAGKFPQLMGIGKNMHGLAHGAKKGEGGKALGTWDTFLSEQFSRFLTRLQSIKEGEATLLDSTAVLYGSSNSNTHQNTNYPLILAGGRGLGFQHGAYRVYQADTPLSNLHVTLLNQLGLPTRSFADSTGDFKELLAS